MKHLLRWAPVLGALALVTGCRFNIELGVPGGADLPEATEVARVWGGSRLMRFHDLETGLVCYMLDSSGSAPSCVKVDAVTGFPSLPAPVR